MLNKRFYGSSETTAHYFPAQLLSDCFLLSAYPLSSLAVSCYKCMRLTTSATVLMLLREQQYQLTSHQFFVGESDVRGSNYIHMNHIIFQLNPYWYIGSSSGYHCHSNSNRKEFFLLNFSFNSKSVFMSAYTQLQPQRHWCDWHWSRSSGQITAAKRVTGGTEVSKVCS